MTESYQIDARRDRRRTVKSVSYLAYFILLIAIAGAGGGLYRALDVELPSVLHGNGTVTPVGKVRQILSPMDGRLASHKLREGMVVEAGQELFRIDSKENSIDTDALESKLVSLRIAIVRLEAEAAGANSLKFPGALSSLVEARREQETFNLRKSRFERQLGKLRDIVAKTNLGVAEQRAAADRHARARELAQEELDVLKPLVTRGISPKLEYLRVRQKVQDLESLRQQAALAVPRLLATLRDTQRNLEEAVSAFRSQARRELNEKQTKLTLTQRELDKGSVPKTTMGVTAPVRGKILNLSVSNTAKTIRMSQVLIEIAPITESLLINARLYIPLGVDIQAGQKATVTTGASNDLNLDGIVEKIQPALGSNQNGQRPTILVLRINAGSPGFDHLSQIGGAVGVTIETSHGVLEYLWDTLIGARGRSFSWP